MARLDGAHGQAARFSLCLNSRTKRNQSQVVSAPAAIPEQVHQRQSHHTAKTGEPCLLAMVGEMPNCSASPTSSGCNALTASRNSSAGIVTTTRTVSVNGQQPSPGSSSQICA